MNRNSVSGIDTLTLERYLLGELEDADISAVESALEKDPQLRERLKSLRRSNQEIMDEYTPEYVEGLVSQKLRRGAGSKAAPAAKKRALKPVLTSAFTLIALTTALFIARENGSPVREHTVLKGEQARLFLFKKGPSGPLPLKDGSAAAENDLIQISYRVPAGYCACVVSIDGRGRHTLHYPPEGAEPARSEGGEIFLPTSYQLDDAPGSEKFFLAASENPPDIKTVIQAALKAAEKGIPVNPGEGVITASFVLRKER
jgi:hypothetical protein